MATGRDKDNTHLIRRDFRQDHGGGPEIPTKSTRKKAGPWCKKEGREHRWDKYVAYEWTNSDGTKDRKYRWYCLSCGKREWQQPRPVNIPQHDYSDTKIVEEWWAPWTYLYEMCSVCGKLGDKITVEKDEEYD